MDIIPFTLASKIKISKKKHNPLVPPNLYNVILISLRKQIEKTLEDGKTFPVHGLEEYCENVHPTKLKYRLNANPTKIPTAFVHRKKKSKTKNNILKFSYNIKVKEKIF